MNSSPLRGPFVAFLLVTLTLFAGELPAHAADRCPLSNPAYSDIRAAAARLQEKIALGKGCEAIEAKLASFGSSIQTAVDEVYKADEERRKKEAAGSTNATEDAATAAATQAKLKTAVSGVTSIVDLLGKYSSGESGNCGKVLLTKTDYLEAVVDTVNGLVPYMIAFSGGTAAPVAIGAMAIGGVTKALIQFFRSRTIDMKIPANRRLFIENACSYYIFNENYEALQNRAAQIVDADAKVVELTQAVKDLEAKGTPAVAPALIQIGEWEEALKKDVAYVTGTETLIARLGGDDATTYEIVRTRVMSKYWEGPVGRLEAILSMTETDPKLAMETAVDRELIEFFRALNNPKLWTLEATALDEKTAKPAAAQALKWLKQIKYIFESTHRELDRPGRRDLALAARKEWEKKLAETRLALKREEDRVKWLKSLNQEGQWVENSEISQTRDDARDGLFKDQIRRLIGGWGPHDDSPAHAWLAQKNDAAELKLREFRSRRGMISKFWLKAFPEPDTRTPLPSLMIKEDACSSIKSQVFTWVTANSHVEAAKAFCRAFKDTINGTVFPGVAEYCLGKYKASAREYKGSINHRTQENVKKHVKEVQGLIDWSRKAGCPLPKRLEQTAF